MNMQKLLNAAGSFDPNAKAPEIPQVAGVEERPLWSVMIPVFNCAHLLEQSLRSVLAQDPGPELMQIEVIDDCSTKDDPAKVVEEIGKGRVKFYRQPQNGGAINNFNTCIKRSRGKLVHILHGDDWIEPGFYEEVERIHAVRPRASIYATRTFMTDEQGIILEVTPLIPQQEADSQRENLFNVATPVQTASVVIPRSVYEEIGGFMPDLVHTADVEMWWRTSRHGGIALSEKVLANYRIFAGNDTGRLAQQAKNLEDMARLIIRLQQRSSSFPAKYCWHMLYLKACEQEAKFAAAGNNDAFAHNRAFRRSIENLGLVAKRLVKSLFKDVSKRILG
jgi:glycosyltransferase involved in cell wall biosynthesis